MTVKLIEVIMVGSDRGDGAPGNPRRAVWQYWSKDGRLLADVDTAGLDIPVDAIGYRLAEALERIRQLEAEPELLDARANLLRAKIDELRIRAGLAQGDGAPLLPADPAPEARAPGVNRSVPMTDASTTPESAPPVPAHKDVAMSFDLGPALLEAVGIVAPMCFQIELHIEAGDVPVLRVDSYVERSHLPTIQSLVRMAHERERLRVERREVPPTSVGVDGAHASVDNPGKGQSTLGRCDDPATRDPRL